MYTTLVFRDGFEVHRLTRVKLGRLALEAVSVAEESVHRCYTTTDYDSNDYDELVKQLGEFANKVRETVCKDEGPNPKDYASIHKGMERVKEIIEFSAWRPE